MIKVNCRMKSDKRGGEFILHRTCFLIGRATKRNIDLRERGQFPCASQIENKYSELQYTSTGYWYRWCKPGTCGLLHVATLLTSISVMKANISIVLICRHTFLKLRRLRYCGCILDKKFYCKSTMIRYHRKFTYE